MTSARLLRTIAAWGAAQAGLPPAPLPLGPAADAALLAVPPLAPSPAAPWPDDERTRTAVHEAGHAVAAWACPRVVAVTRATIEAQGDVAGQVDYQIAVRDPGDAWAVVVIGLAGLAAELRAYGRARSGPARSDLTHVRREAARTRGVLPPWPTDEADAAVTYPGARVHRPPLSTREALVLDAAYAMAARVLAAHTARVAAVARLLLERGTVRRIAIERVAGDRRLVVSMGARPVFWLPTTPGATT